jgi:AraC family transcriptional regulator
MFTEKYFPKTYTYFIRHIGSYKECKPAWDKMIAWSMKNNVNFQDVISFGIGHDNPNLIKECRYDACIGFSCETDISKNDGVDYKIIEETKCISIIHKGSYDKLFDTYRAIYTQENKDKYKIITQKPAMEIYKNSPIDTKEEDLITEIFIPVE